MYVIVPPGETLAGDAVFVMARSVRSGVTVTVLVAVLFPVFGSGLDAVTEAVLLMLPLPCEGLILAIAVKVAVAPPAKEVELAVKPFCAGLGDRVNVLLVVTDCKAVSAGSKSVN